MCACILFIWTYLCIDMHKCVYYTCTYNMYFIYIRICTHVFFINHILIFNGLFCPSVRMPVRLWIYFLIFACVWGLCFYAHAPVSKCVTHRSGLETLETLELQGTEAVSLAARTVVRTFFSKVGWCSGTCWALQWKINVISSARLGWCLSS